MEPATREVETIFGGGNGWGNNSAPPSAPLMLGITGGAAVMMPQHATTFTSGGNAHMAGKTAQNLHRAMMGETPTLHNTVVGGNIIGGTTGISAAPPAAPSAGQKQCMGRGSTGWSVLTEAVKMFGPEAKMQEFSKKLLKW